ncbi:DMT family transporter [Neobacillus massiliamazoniensis]|uniref:SMR family multidrug resistance protein n=1 Tax=Neobacillus massiliamazoniensis TaxID=1499688 RepID=A0A0U1P4I9_9BACI|nr:multidrug efflux SMR transporter [Neobacillus massiliamazoniensis]CRK85003.1 SMR family multidrug resistance protein [Neobacillus massiliamazoniensis]
MSWVYLLIAGIAEIGSVISLKQAKGFTKWLPSIACLFFGSLSFYFLSLALKVLPIGPAYAIWTGIGTVGSVIVGMMFFHESKDIKRIVLIICILIGTVGVKITSGL